MQMFAGKLCIAVFDCQKFSTALINIGLKNSTWKLTVCVCELVLAEINLWHENEQSFSHHFNYIRKYEESAIVVETRQSQRADFLFKFQFNGLARKCREFAVCLLSSMIPRWNAFMHRS